MTLSALYHELHNATRKQAAARVASFAAMARHVWRIATVHVRNIGSVAGNLVLAKTRGFLSDLATVCLPLPA